MFGAQVFSQLKINTKKLLAATFDVFFRWVIYVPLKWFASSSTRSLSLSAKENDVLALESHLVLADEPLVDESNEQDYTPLMVAARHGNLFALILLHRAGADLDRATNMGLTAIMLAAIHGHYEVFYYLLFQGVNIKLRTSAGCTVLQWLVGYERLAMLSVMLEHLDLAVLNHHFEGGNTLLLNAVIANKLSVVKWLLAHGAHLDELNDEGESALTLAKQLQRDEIYTYLSAQVETSKLLSGRSGKKLTVMQLRLAIAEANYERSQSTHDQPMSSSSDIIVALNATSQSSTPLIRSSEQQRGSRLSKKQRKALKKKAAKQQQEHNMSARTDEMAKQSVVASATTLNLRQRKGKKQQQENNLPLSKSVVSTEKDGTDTQLVQPERHIQPLPTSDTVHAIETLTIDYPSEVANVMHVLSERGYQVYLVGGSVRDFILGKTPTDFDMVTNAPIAEVSQYLRIGVLSEHVEGLYRIYDEAINIDILCIESFVWMEDARHRDFTFNALYLDDQKILYDPLSADGWVHLQEKKMIMIEGVETCIEAEPIRLLRCARFMGEHQFILSETDIQTVRELAPYLNRCAPGQIRYELRKLFLRGHAVANFKAMKKLALLTVVFPSIQSHLLTNHEIDSWVESKLQQTDQLVLLKQPVSIHYIYALFQVGYQVSNSSTGTVATASMTVGTSNNAYSFFAKVDSTAQQLLAELATQTGSQIPANAHDQSGFVLA